MKRMNEQVMERMNNIKTIIIKQQEQQQTIPILRESTISLNLSILNKVLAVDRLVLVIATMVPLCSKRKSSIDLRRLSHSSVKPLKDALRCSIDLLYSS